MRRDELYRLISRHVPGGGACDVERIGSGLINETYRILRGGVAYSLRLTCADRGDFGADRRWEARVIECAARAGLAPAMLYCDQSRGVQISQWIDGNVWCAADARQEPGISAMADLLRRVHALPVPIPPRLMGPADWIAFYGDATYWETAYRDTARVRVLTEPLHRHAERLLDMLAQTARADPALCHSDLHRLNLIDRGPALIASRRLVLLDWEYAHVTDPLWDLAAWCANNDFDGELRREFLAQYAGRPPADAEWQRLNLLCWLFDYISVLWSEHYLTLDQIPASPPATRTSAATAIAAKSVSDRAQTLAARLVPG